MLEYVTCVAFILLHTLLSVSLALCAGEFDIKGSYFFSFEMWNRFGFGGSWVFPCILSFVQAVHGSWLIKVYHTILQLNSLTNKMTMKYETSKRTHMLKALILSTQTHSTECDDVHCFNSSAKFAICQLKFDRSDRAHTLRYRIDYAH